MSLLFSPMSVRDVRIKNRLWISPMCQYSAEDGVVNAWHMQWLGSLATGGHGLVFTEATAVSPVGRHSLNDAGIWRDDHVAAWAPVVEFCRSYGATMGIQIAHDGLPAPRPLTTGEIAGVIEDFVNAARRAVAAGFQVIEIHSAHGYLLHEFLSPLSNERTDDYGGSFENRTRLVLEVMRAVRREVGEAVPVFVRLSSTDYIDGGWTIEDTVRLSAGLKDEGCDLIDCSSGGVAPIRLTEDEVGPGYQVKFARAVREGAGIATGAVGLINDAEQAETILEEGSADAILVARAAMRNPHFAMEAAGHLGEAIEWPPQLDRARRVKQRR